MATKRDSKAYAMDLAESAKTVDRVLDATFRREMAERADCLRRLEVAARCGALFAGPEGAPWGIA